jgi:hypothetical protein
MPHLVMPAESFELVSGLRSVTTALPNRTGNIRLTSTRMAHESCYLSLDISLQSHRQASTCACRRGRRACRTAHPWNKAIADSQRDRVRAIVCCPNGPSYVSDLSTFLIEFYFRCLSLQVCGGDTTGCIADCKQSYPRDLGLNSQLRMRHLTSHGLSIIAWPVKCLL